MGLDFQKNSYVLHAKFIRFEEQFAVLQHEALGEFKWPIKNLPDDVKIGDTVSIKISSPGAEKEEQYERMRKLLEELIN